MGPIYRSPVREVTQYRTGHASTRATVKIDFRCCCFYLIFEYRRSWKVKWMMKNDKREKTLDRDLLFDFIALSRSFPKERKIKHVIIHDRSVHLLPFLVSWYHFIFIRFVFYTNYFEEQAILFFNLSSFHFFNKIMSVIFSICCKRIERIWLEPI